MKRRLNIGPISIDFFWTIRQEQTGVLLVEGSLAATTAQGVRLGVPFTSLYYNARSLSLAAILLLVYLTHAGCSLCLYKSLACVLALRQVSTNHLVGGCSS